MKKVFFIFILLSFQSLIFSNEKMMENPEQVFSEAVQLSSVGHFDKAIQKFLYLIEHGYNDRDVYYSLFDTYASKASVLRFSGKMEALNELYQEEMERVKEAIKIYPDDKKMFYYMSDVAKNLNLVEEYVNSLEQILKIDEQDIIANFYLGEYYFLNRQYKEASVYFKKVISLPKENRDIDYMALYRSYYNLGMIYLLDLDYKAALDNFEKARNIYDKDCELLKTIALTYATLLEYDKALEKIRQIPEYCQTDDLIEIYGALLFVKDDPELKDFLGKNKKLSTFLQAIDSYLNQNYEASLDKLDSFVRERQVLTFYSLYLYYMNYKKTGQRKKELEQAFFLGNKAREAGKIDMAIEYYKELKENTNSIPHLYWLIGSLYDDKNDFTNAIYYYDLYVKHPESKEYKVSALIRMSDMYYRTKKKKEAENLLKKAKAIAINKTDIFQIYYYSGLLNFEGKKYRVAMKDFREALKADEKQPRLYFFIGTCYYELGDRGNAISYLEKGRNYEEQSPEMNNLLAYLYSLEKRNLKEALSLVNSALSVYPDNFAYLDTLGWIYFQQEEYEKSFEVFSRVLGLIDAEKNQEGMDEIYYHVGMLYEKMGDKKEAQKYFLKAFKINPRNKLVQLKVK